MKNTLLIIICGLVIAAMGCNTIGGVGEDMGTIGNWIIRGSENVKEKVTPKDNK